jgi:WD40 repeat protein
LTGNCEEPIAECRFKFFDSANLVVRAITISPDHKWALVGCQATTTNDGGLRIVDLDAGKEIHSLDVKLRYSFATAFTSDGKFVILDRCDRCPNKPLEKAYLTLWNLSKDKAERELPKRDGGSAEPRTRNCGNAHSLSFSPDDKLLFTCDDDGMFRMWHVATAKAAWSVARFFGWANFSSDGKQIIALIQQKEGAASFSWHVEVFDAKTGERLSHKKAEVGP